MSMIDAKLGMLVGLLEDQQRRNAQAAAQAKKAQQSQGGQGGGGEGGSGGEGGCGGAKQPASPQAQQGARECQSACGAQKQQCVGENGCSGASPTNMQAQQPPRPSRGIGEGGNPAPDEQGVQPRNPSPDVSNPPRNPSPDANDPVRNPPRNPSPDAQDNPPRNPPRRNPSPDAQAVANATRNANQANQANQPRNDKLAKLLEENPNIKTAKDLMQHFLDKGGGNHANAVQQAKEVGVRLTQLMADRQADVRRFVGGNAR